MADGRIHPVLLAGGSGTRLWPSSRRDFPKQFANLLGGESLFQSCLRRVTGPLFASPMIVTTHDLRFIARGQSDSIGVNPDAVLVEPHACSTAPAVLGAALMLEACGAELMLVAPCDHAMGEAAAFPAAVEAAAGEAAKGALVTFGIPPTRPETGYGYLELDGGAEAAAEPRRLLRFVEKPDAATAAAMVASGRFLWNAGIFLFGVLDIIAAFARFAPEILQRCRRAIGESTADSDFVRLGAGAYAGMPEISIDRAIMEKADNLSVVPYHGPWSDLGTWQAVWEQSRNGPDGLSIHGPVTAIGCRDSLLRSEDRSVRLVGVGLEGIAAVATPDAVLVADLGAGARIRDVVATLLDAGLPQATESRRVHRPWGWFETVDEGPGFRVKRIVVQPGASLSLQSHARRSEHWVVVAGEARVTIGGTERLVTVNGAAYVAPRDIHRLANPGPVNLEVIEVQSGDYVGEDDITRLDDDYGRT